MTNIIGFFRIVAEVVLMPIFYLQERSLKKRVNKFTQIFGFDPYGPDWHSNQVRVMRTLLELGDKMPYERRAAARYKEAERAASRCHFLTDPQYYKIFTDPEGREEMLRFIEELSQGSEEEDSP